MTVTERSRGHTLIEVVMAVTILAAGSAVLWYGLRSTAEIDRRNRMHHAANLLARSDLEFLRGVPKGNIHDTVYLASGVGPDSLVLVRTVMDSARIANTLDELVLDEKLSPKEWRKPLEVRARVFALDQGEDAPAFDPDDFILRFGFGGEGRVEAEAGGPTAPLASLILKLPEYKWW